MARKKTISISRKPLADAAPLEDFAPSVTDGPSALALNLKPPAADERDGQDSRALPASLAYSPLGLAIYGPVYCISFSIMFSTILLGKLIPGSALIGQAWQDGTEAAQHNFRHK